MKYSQLNLKEVREKANLDFAHFTYKKGQCSCCFGPEDLPSIYWKNKEVIPMEDVRWLNNEVSYILFKNASNGSGIVTKNDTIEEHTNIEYDVSDMEQLKLVVDELNKQLNPNGLTAKMPENFSKCIEIIKYSI